MTYSASFPVFIRLLFGQDILPSHWLRAGSARLMLHLHALFPVASLGVAAADALLISTANPGKMARVTFFDGDFMQVAHAIERGHLANAGQPLACDEVDDWVSRALGETPPTRQPGAKSA